MAPVSTGLNLPFAWIVEGVRAGGHPAVLGARQPLAPLLPLGCLRPGIVPLYPMLLQNCPAVQLPDLHRSLG